MTPVCSNLPEQVVGVDTWNVIPIFGKYPHSASVGNMRADLPHVVPDSVVDDAASEAKHPHLGCPRSRSQSKCGDREAKQGRRLLLLILHGENSVPIPSNSPMEPKLTRFTRAANIQLYN